MNALLLFSVSVLLDFCSASSHSHKDEMSYRRRQLEVLNCNWSSPAIVASFKDEHLNGYFEIGREVNIDTVAIRFNVPKVTAALLFGDWNLRRIEQVNKFALDTGSRFASMEDLTRFLPDGWEDSEDLVLLLKKIMASNIKFHFSDSESHMIRMALGDWNEARVRHMERIFIGEWKHCPVSLSDLRRYLLANFMDADLEKYFKGVMMERAFRMLDTSDEETVTLFFNNFSNGRVKYLRGMILNHWHARPATIQELLQGLPEDSLQNPKLPAAMHEFRLKTLLAHKYFHTSSIVFSLLASTKSRTLQKRIEVLCHLGIGEIVGICILAESIIRALEAMKNAQERREFMRNASEEFMRPTEDEINQEYVTFRREQIPTETVERISNEESRKYLMTRRYELRREYETVREQELERTRRENEYLQAHAEQRSKNASFFKNELMEPFDYMRLILECLGFCLALAIAKYYT